MEGLGHLQSIHMNHLNPDRQMVVFMNISSLRLTFIAMMIINDDDDEVNGFDDTVVVTVRDSASWIRIRLEYIYTLFTMTSTDMAAIEHVSIFQSTSMKVLQCSLGPLF